LASEWRIAYDDIDSTIFRPGVIECVASKKLQAVFTRFDTYSISLSPIAERTLRDNDRFGINIHPAQAVQCRNGAATCANKGLGSGKQKHSGSTSGITHGERNSRSNRLLMGSERPSNELISDESRRVVHSISASP
jgi:hypothetical protein